MTQDFFGGEIIEDAEPHTKQEAADPVVAPPVLFLSAIAASILAQVWWPIEGWFPLWARGVGLLAATLCFAWGSRSLRRLEHYSTPSSPYQATSTLVTDGPFAVSRNPIYLALTGCHLATALIADNPWILLSALAYFVLLYPCVIAYEEEYLEQQFAEDYLRYCQRVRRWL